MELQELLKQKDELDRQIVAIKSQSRNEAVAKIRQLMQEHGLTVSDLASAAKAVRSGKSNPARKPVAAKYKDGSGNQWTGRGLKPKWLTQALSDGKRLEDFAI